jgi:sodium-coupled neutral amino acid transporter 9
LLLRVLLSPHVSLELTSARAAPHDCHTPSLRSDIYAFCARFALVFQLMTVFPLLLLIIRTQVFGLLWRNTYPSVLHVSGLNAAVMAITFTMAALNLQVSSVLRFTGAIGGIALVFFVPVAIDVVVRRKAGTASPLVYAMHALIMAVGVLFFALQFVPTL